MSLRPAKKGEFIFLYLFACDEKTQLVKEKSNRPWKGQGTDGPQEYLKLRT